MNKENTTYARLLLRVHNLVAVILGLVVVILLGWLSTRYPYSLDWTSSGRHSLSEASKALLARLDKPVEITAYASPAERELRELIQDFIDRYRRVKPDVTLRFVDPAEAPDELRELGIHAQGELIVRYEGRSEHVQKHTEQSLTNALQRLIRAKERWIVFLTGHGERSPFGQANRDLGQWGEQLDNRGFKTQTLNLGANPTIPDNTSVLVIASPEIALLPGELKRIEEYIDRGGNLLWLVDPGPVPGLETLAQKLGLRLQAGTIVDPATRLFGIDQPAIVPVGNYGSHPVVQDFNYITVFPYARPIQAEETIGDWRTEVFLTTGSEAWAETGEIKGEINYDPGTDLQGPVTLGMSLTRTLPPKEGTGEDQKGEGEEAKEQRVIVIGDGDFLSNSYLGNSGNLDLGLNIVNWLAADEELIAIPARTANDLTLELSRTASIVLGFGFLLVLPLALGGTGLFIWLKRKKR